MAVNGKGKQIASKAPAASSSSKRKKPVPQELLDRRKKRKHGVHQFIDDAAEDSDFEEEYEEADEEEDNDFDFEDERADLGSSKGGTSTWKDHKVSGKPQYLPFLVKEEEVSGDELEELIRDRYGRGSEHVVFNEDARDYDDDEVVEHTDKDPNIWRVKCAVGREQQFAFCLMHKYADLQRRGIKMEIVSAFTLEHVKGYVYIEADKECDVVEACKGFLSIYPSRMGPVPKNEIPSLLSVRNKPCGVSKGTWVRMKSGNYKGDLGQVVDYDEARRKATIKIVPRIDLQAIAKKFGGGISLKGAAVPAPRLISSHELEHFRPHIEIKRDRHSGEVFEVLDGLMLKDGYLYKKVSIASIVYWGVQPSKDELLKFTETSKTEDEDYSWLSSVFNVRKKTKPSNDTYTEGTSEQGSGFNLHDLVLYGRNGFGVIVDTGKDGIKILKGDPNVQEVMIIKSQDIKNNCIDKMFTASDRKKKTIYINDVIKVLDGPMEGREGIVKHMYKGTLFIYDESQEENSGIFCVKSGSCENTSSPKDSLRKAGNKSSSSFNQSSFESGEHEDGSRSFSRNQHESNQIFSIGQTLRIRKGPLKGYLCHVMGIYRSDVTVKLGSLGKVITVQEQFLSVPNVKRDISTETSSDFFGAQGAGSTWEALTNSSFAFSSEQKTEQAADPWGSSGAVASAEQAADPWGSSGAVASAEQAADPWGSSGAVASAEQAADPWGSSGAVASAEQAADPWGSSGAVASAGQGSAAGCDPWAGNPASGNSEIQAQSTNAWDSSTAGISTDQGGSDPWGSKQSSGPSEKAQGVTDPWGTVKKASADNGVTTDNTLGSTGGISTDQGGSDPWGSKLLSGPSDNGVRVDKTWGSAAGTSTDHGGSDPWGSKPSSGPSEKAQAVTDPWGTVKKASAEKSQDPWGSAVKASADEGTKTDDTWGGKTAGVSSNPTKPVESGAFSFGGGESTSAWNKPLESTPATDKKQEADPWSSKVSAATTDHNQTSDQWASKASPATKDRVVDPWGTKIAAADHKGPKQKDESWGEKAALSNCRQSKPLDGWEKADDKMGGSSEKEVDAWNKPSVKSLPVTEAADPWGSKLAGGSKDIEQGADPWASKVATGSKDKEHGADPWSRNVPAEACKDTPAVEQNDKSSSSWDQPKTSGGNQSGWGSSGWDKEGSTKNESSKPAPFGGDDKFDQKESWDKPSNFEGGRGFGGRGRGRGRFGNRDNFQDNNSSDFGGGGWGSGERGSGRGRGGRYGNRQDDTDNSSSGFGGGWGSGERGRRGGGFGNRDRDEDNNSTGFGGRGGWSSGGRGGRFQSSDGDNNNDFGSSSWNQTAKNDTSGGGWNTPMKSSNDWSASKSGGDGEANWTPNKSTAGGDNLDKSKSILGEPPSKSWNANEEAGVGNWDSKPKTDFGGNQSSGWGSNSNSGNDWSKPKTSWNDSTTSNFDDNGGSSFGFRGRSDSFRGGCGPRGGRGRNFNGGGRGNFGSGDQSENFSDFGGRGGQTSNWNEGADKSSWNSGGSNTSWSKQDTDKTNGNEGGGNWSSGPKDVDNNNGSGSGWNTGGTPNKEKATSGWGDTGPSPKKDDGGWGSGSTNEGSKGGW